MEDWEGRGYTEEYIKNMVKSFGWSGVTISNDAQFKKFDDPDSLSDDMFVACTDCVTWIYKPEVPK